MKKVLVLVMSLILVFVMTACGGSTSEPILNNSSSGNSVVEGSGNLSINDEETEDSSSKDEEAKDVSSKNEASEDNSSKDKTTSDNDEESEDSSSKDEEAKDVSSKNEASEDNSSKDKTTSDDAWRNFLKEYEEWVDKYIAVIKKYNANPTDLSILTEYTSLMTELADWTAEADDISDSIVDVEDAAEYSAELIRIAAKLAEATGDL